MAGVDINRALRVYFAADARGGVMPFGGEARVRSEYGEQSASVLGDIRRLLDQIDIPREVSQRATLQEIGTLAEEQARAWTPPLEDDVVRAIGNYVSYSYR